MRPHQTCVCSDSAGFELDAPRSSIVTRTDMSESAEPAVSSRIAWAGPLLKKSAHLKKWRRRWFIALRNPPALIYFKTQAGCGSLVSSAESVKRSQRAGRFARHVAFARRCCTCTRAVRGHLPTHENARNLQPLRQRLAAVINGVCWPGPPHTRTRTCRVSRYEEFLKVPVRIPADPDATIKTRERQCAPTHTHICTGTGPAPATSAPRTGLACAVPARQWIAESRAALLHCVDYAALQHRARVAVRRSRPGFCGGR